MSNRYESAYTPKKKNMALPSLHVFHLACLPTLVPIICFLVRCSILTCLLLWRTSHIRWALSVFFFFCHGTAGLRNSVLTRGEPRTKDVFHWALATTLVVMVNNAVMWCMPTFYAYCQSVCVHHGIYCFVQLKIVPASATCSGKARLDFCAEMISHLCTFDTQISKL